MWKERQSKEILLNAAGVGYVSSYITTVSDFLRFLGRKKITDTMNNIYPFKQFWYFVNSTLKVCAFLPGFGHSSILSLKYVLTYHVFVVLRPKRFLVSVSITATKLISRFGRIKLTVRVPGSSGNSVVDCFLAVHVISLNNKISQALADINVK